MILAFWFDAGHNVREWCQEMGQRFSEAVARQRPEGVVGENSISYTASNYFRKKGRETLRTLSFGCQNNRFSVDPSVNPRLFVEKFRAVS